MQRIAWDRIYMKAVPSQGNGNQVTPL